MKKVWWIAILPGILAAAVGVFFVTLLIVRSMWTWVMPDLFPGAIAQGLIAKSLSWYSAFKLALFVGFLGGIARSITGGGHG